MLAEFGSVVDAVACAIDIHQRNADGLPLRIGINLGDVIIEGDDIYGDGVNIAARLKSSPSPGKSGVGQVLDQVEAKLDVAFDDLGQKG